MREENLISSLSAELRKLRTSKVCVSTHVRGDPDSIGSAYVLLRMLRGAYGVSETYFYIPDSPSTHSKALLNYLSLEVSENPMKSEYFIVLDTGSPEQLGELSEILSEPEKAIVIDHHSETSNRFPEGVRIYSSDKYQSVAEIIFDLADKEGYRLDSTESEALFAGIYYDTVRLSIADEESFRKICRLISTGIIPRKILSNLEFTVDISERIAKLKAAGRMRLYRFGDWLIAFSEVGSFQSSAARAFIGLGAHLAVVAGEADDGYNVSMRAVHEFSEKTGINLGVDLAQVIGEKLSGHGGGHPTAARAYCKVENAERIFSLCLYILSDKLGLQAELMKF